MIAIAAVWPERREFMTNIFMLVTCMLSGMVLRVTGRAPDNAHVPAIARTTPILLGLFSLITLWANEAYTTRTPSIRITSWYRKSLPTFSDALATIRRELWACGNLSGSRQILDPTKIPSPQLNALIDLACYAA